MVDAPDDVERMVERLSVPGTWARHKDNLVASSAAETLVRDDAPFEAANLIQSLSSQLAEMRDLLDRKVNEKIAEVQARKAAEAERDRLAAENEALREALTPSADTKAAYWGEFYMGVTLHARGQEDYRRVQIPWTSIKEIMAAIAARAALDTAKGAEK